MKVNIYSDKFSGTLSASEVLGIIKSVFKNSDIQAKFFPVTDGGEGSTEIFKHYNMPIYQTVMKKDFAGNWIPAESLSINNQIFFESASLIGVNNSILHPYELNTSCLSQIIREVDVLGLGGSKTVDGGIGLLSSLGIDFYSDEELITDPKPKDFARISSVKILDSFTNLEMKVLTDTAIPLLGNNSAISAYGPQKGLNRKEITQTQEQLQRIYELLATALKITLDPYDKNTGAAGGLSFVFEKILGCKIISGAEFFLKETSLIHKIPRSPITVVCEGKFDKTSLSGKVVGEILRHVSGDRYFLGGQYDYIDSNEFNGIYECGPKGLLNPKEELKNVAGKLLEQISI